MESKMHLNCKFDQMVVANSSCSQPTAFKIHAFFMGRQGKKVYYGQKLLSQ